ncbi:hypothetical protein [Actinomyces vulturis]|uniref:hypothetical protein n=1 Tax=Actinomyces vulturis TaxID=1857645 RepID=UPI001146BA10|nr:hypothetical protein [Actinomyces vulturis]
MHGNSTILLKRLDRTLDERICPAVATPVALLDVRSWSVPESSDGSVGEPVPFSRPISRDLALYSGCLNVLISLFCL